MISLRGQVIGLETKLGTANYLANMSVSGTALIANAAIRSAIEGSISKRAKITPAKAILNHISQQM